MPPEPLPWDRKDFYKERKHERTESQPQQPLTARWRDSSSMSSYQYGSFREFHRWGSADFHRPPGHGKQGGWHLFAEENGGHGYVPSRSGDKILDESCRQSVSCGDGKYGRNSTRENNRGSYTQGDWRGHSWETSNGSPNTPGRPHDVNNERRSVDDKLMYTSHTHSDFVNTWDQLQKDQHDNKTSGVNGLGTGQRCEGGNSVCSMDWKPLKWSRSGSLSSRGSGFSHSNSTKSLGGIDSGEGMPKLQQKNLTPVQSPSGDAAACIISAVPSDETTSRKKPRLGWGEGLAKYEKKKVEGPDTSMNRGEATISVGNTESNNSPSSNLADKSPRVPGDCASPATPSSVACSSSPGVEEKSFGKAANIDNDISNLCGSPSLGSQNHLEGPSFSLEKLDTNSVINMGSSLTDLLQSDDPSTVDSSFVHTTAINKLLLWKGDGLKALEMTESEIDSLENELKSLKGDSGSRFQCPATSSSLPVKENGKACEEQEAVSITVPRPVSLKIDPCGDVFEEKLPLSNGVLEEVNADVKDGDIDSPGTATSKFVEPSSLEKAVSPSGIVKFHECSGNLDTIQLKTIEEVILATGSSNEGTGAPISGEGSVLKKINDDAHVPESSNSDAGGENIIYDVISTTNKELANGACKVFNNLLPKDQYRIEISEIANVACRQTDSSIREKIAMRKQYLRFKERVLALKFKAFQHAWNEDMRSLSMRKYRAKSQKKYEFSLRSTHGGYQKYRSSIRSQVTSPGNLILEPNAGMINVASKLLLDSNVRLYRNALKMPALFLDEKEKQVSRFISSNGLVEDPCAVEKERALINPWTSEEKEIFMDKLAAFGKDFRKIASFLDHKTTADCVEFYYKNHKSESFEKTKKKLDLSKQGKSSANTYLLTSGKKWSRELNAASLDVLGAASVIAAHAESGMRNRQMSSGRIFLGHFDSKTSRVDDSIAERSSSFDIIRNDRESGAADVLAGICGSLSSEAISSCITSSADPGESYHHEWKCHKVDSVVKRPSTSDVTQNVDDDTCSDDSCGEMDPTDWTDEEKSVFVQAVSSYGKNFGMISRFVGTRSRDQCKVFFSKARKCLGLDLIHPRTRNIGTPMSDDANGGGSDMEDACVLESSVVCCDKLVSKMDDLPSTIVSMNVDVSDPNGEVSLQTDMNLSEEKNGRLVDHGDSEAVEAMVSDVGQTEPISEGGGDDMVVDSNKAESVHVQKSVALANLNAVRNHVAEQGVSVAVSGSLGEAVDPCRSSLDAVLEPKSDAGCSTEGFGNDLEAWETSLSKNGLDERDTKCSADTSSRSICGLDSNKTSDESGDKNSCSDFSFSTKDPHQGPPDLDSAEKPSVILLQKESSSAKNSALHDSDAFQCEKICNQDRLSSTLDYQENEDKRAKKSVSGDESDRLSGKPLVDLADSYPILRGYPLQISTLKEMNGDVSFSQLPEVKSLSTSKRGFTGPYLAQDCYLQKCNGSESAAELPLPVQNLERANGHPKSHSRSLSDTEKPCRNGNVKLFGQILGSSSQDDDKVAHSPKQSTKSSNLKFRGHNNASGNASLSKFDRNNYHVSENVPKRSYGFWDGHRIQTGLSSLPDSAILVAKYPAAFVNYPASSSQMEQQALQTVVRSTERNLNGVAVFSPRETSSNNGAVDYQVYRGHDCTKVAPFTIDMKQRQKMFSEMQRQNGFDSIPNLQQQGRGMLGMNVVGRGVLVGGSCPSLSDPVAVLRMQYAKTEQYGGQSGSIIREEDSWRGKGDIGR